MRLQRRIDEARHLLGELREQSAGADAVLDILSNAMDAIDRANGIVMSRDGRLTQADKRPLMSLAQALEGAGADLVVALRKLPAS